MRWLAAVCFVIASVADPAVAQPARTGSATQGARGQGHPASSPSKHEKESEGLQWNESWPRFRWWEYVQTGVLIGIAPYLATIEGPSETRWRGGILFDDALRPVFTVDDKQARLDVSEASDYFWHGTELFPVFDVLIAAGLAQQAWDVTLQLTLMNLQAIGLTGFMSRLLHITVGRDRPSGADCEQDPEYDFRCGARSRNSGFFSGHTSLAFTGAALTCAHHSNVPLYGGGWVEAIPCAATMLGATATGIMRLMADRHYMTDILASIAFGLFSGYGLPHLLHYTDDDDQDSEPPLEGDPPRGQKDATGVLVFPYAEGASIGVRATGVL